MNAFFPKPEACKELELVGQQMEGMEKQARGFASPHLGTDHLESAARLPSSAAASKENL